MNLKKIILEEVDNLQWMKDIALPITKDNLHIGMGVRLSQDSIFYKYGEEGDETNPINVTGTIVNYIYDYILPIGVRWDNGFDNNYSYEDLVTR